MEWMQWQDSTVVDTVAMLGRTIGVAGEPLSYALRNDNIITLLLFAGFIVSAIAFGNMQRFVLSQLKNFFYIPRNDFGRITLSSSELRPQLFLVMQTCMLLSLLAYLFVFNYIGTDAVIAERYSLMLTFLVVFAGYFIVRALLYAIINEIFFNRRQAREWLRSLLFITSMESILLFPVVLIAVYHDLDITTVEICVASVIGLVKLMLVCKCYAIFFRRLGLFVRLFLYLCALEAVPFLLMWAGLAHIWDGIN